MSASAAVTYIGSSQADLCWAPKLGEPSRERARKAGLITDTYMEATNVEKHKKSYHDFVPDWEMEQEIHLG